MLWIVITVGVLITLLGIVLYNKIIAHRNFVNEAWSNIEVQLKRRHDLIPNLVETVKKYSSYEQSALVGITEQRNASAALEDQVLSSYRLNTENKLTDRLKQFWGLVENYPDLKAQESFLNLQQQLTEVEDQIQLARRYYNGTVRDHNTLIESFPANMIAKLFQFKVNIFFQIEHAMVSNPPVIEMQSDKVKAS